MSNADVIAILKDHSIEYCSKDGRVEALDISTTPTGRHAEWVDVTDWSHGQLMQWLGY